jgi:hypothetical protein
MESLSRVPEPKQISIEEGQQLIPVDCKWPAAIPDRFSEPPIVELWEFDSQIGVTERLYLKRLRLSYSRPGCKHVVSVSYDLQRFVKKETGGVQPIRIAPQSYERFKSVPPVRPKIPEGYSKRYAYHYDAKGDVIYTYYRNLVLKNGSEVTISRTDEMVDEIDCGVYFVDWLRGATKMTIRFVEGDIELDEVLQIAEEI